MEIHASGICVTLLGVVVGGTLTLDADFANTIDHQHYEKNGHYSSLGGSQSNASFPILTS